MNDITLSVGERVLTYSSDLNSNPSVAEYRVASIEDGIILLEPANVWQLAGNQLVPIPVTAGRNRTDEPGHSLQVVAIDFSSSPTKEMVERFRQVQSRIRARRQ